MYPPERGLPYVLSTCANITAAIKSIAGVLILQRFIRFVLQSYVPYIIYGNTARLNAPK